VRECRWAERRSGVRFSPEDNVEGPGHVHVDGEPLQ